MFLPISWYRSACYLRQCICLIPRKLIHSVDRHLDDIEIGMWMILAAGLCKLGGILNLATPQSLDSFECNLSYSPGLLIRFHFTLVTLLWLSGGGPGASPGRKPTAFSIYTDWRFATMRGMRTAVVVEGHPVADPLAGLAAT